MKQFSQEKVTRELKRPIPQSPLLLSACDALAGSEQKYINVACCKAERFFLIGGIIQESILGFYLKRYLDLSRTTFSHSYKVHRRIVLGHTFIAYPIAKGK